MDPTKDNSFTEQEENQNRAMTEEPAPEVGAQVEYPRGLKQVAIMTSLTLGTTLMALNATIISVATPKISILLTTVICVSVPTALGMRWLNIKKVSQERDGMKQTQSGQLGTEEAPIDDTLKSN